MTAVTGEPSPAPLWEPSEERRRRSRIAAFLDHHGYDDYDEAWRWSVDRDTAGAFWAAIASDIGVRWHSGWSAELERPGEAILGTRWFPGGTLNYAEQALRVPAGGAASPAVVARSNTRGDQELTWEELSDLTGRVRAGLAAAGVGRGDRVAAYLPNLPETLAAMLATASLGAIWTCCSPETGISAVLDRLAQVEPVVLLAVDGYRYGERSVDRIEEAEAIRQGLPSLRQAVLLPYLHPGRHAPGGWGAWGDLVAQAAAVAFEPVPFDHPLYVLYSSGTTGKPKAIVHGHGGILLEHAKALALHFDIGPADRFFWFTTTGWMMWNFAISALVVDSPVVLFDGDPAWPAPDALWALMATTGVTCGGVGSGYLVACRKAGLKPGSEHDLSALKTIGATGSPLPTAAAKWVYDEVAPDTMLASFSGGTDVCTGFVGPSPLHPVWGGEISCRCLGAPVAVFDEDGREVIGEEGELVLEAPMPSMPVSFWGDKDGSLYRSAYFDRFRDVWAHGDRATLTERGSVIITGRSDGTLNRGGVRMGTAEFYAVIESLPEVADSLAVHVEDPEGGPGLLWLFVVPADGAATRDLGRTVAEALRRELSPRHVPDRIVEVAEVPRTLTGKKLEVPVKRILSGVPPDTALTMASVANPDSLDPIIRLAGETS